MPTDKYDKYAVQDFYDTTKSLDQKQSSLSFFKAGDDELVPIRLDDARSIKEGHSRFLCGYCKEPLHICGNLSQDNTTGSQHYHFRHYREQVPGSHPCPYRRENEKFFDKDTWKRMIYHGLPTNPEHERIQNAIWNWVGVWDTDAQKEKYIRDEQDYNLHRKADVYAEIEGKKVVFEVQRTSTNIGTIIGRDDFYRSHGMYVVWVITEPENKTCAKRDIFYDNAENFFVYDEAAQEMSEELHELCLTCYYCNWTFDNNGNYARCNQLSKKTMPFMQLTFNTDNYQVYYANPDELKHSFEQTLCLHWKERLDAIMECSRIRDVEYRLTSLYYDRLRGVSSKLHKLKIAETHTIVLCYLRNAIEQIHQSNLEYNADKVSCMIDAAYSSKIRLLPFEVTGNFDIESAIKNPSYSISLLLTTTPWTRKGFKDQISKHTKDYFVNNIVESNSEQEKRCFIYALSCLYHIEDEEQASGAFYDLIDKWPFFAALFSIALGRLNLRFNYKTWMLLAKYVNEKHNYGFKLFYDLAIWKLSTRQLNDPELQDYLANVHSPSFTRDRYSLVANSIFKYTSL